MDEMFSIDVTIFEQPKKIVIGNRYTLLNDKIEKLLDIKSVNDNIRTHKPNTVIYDNVAAWILLNFSSNRARKHFIVETKNWRLVKKEGGEVELLYRKYERFVVVNKNETYLVSILKELAQDEKYLKMPSGGKLVSVYKYIFGRCLFSRICKDNYYDYNNILFNLKDAKLIFTYRYTDGEYFRYGIRDKTNSEITNLEIFDITTNTKIYTFEYNGHVYDIKKYFDLKDIKEERYRAEDHSRFFELYCSNLFDDKLYSGRMSDESKCFYPSSVIKQLEHFDKRETVYNIDKYEKFISDCEKEFEVMKELEGCGLLVSNSG